MKNKFIRSVIILLFGGLITKILGMIIKIALTRAIGTEGIGLYSLILPTFNLFITLCSLGMGVAISKVVSEGGYDNKKLVLSVIPFMLVINGILIFFLIGISGILSRFLLKNMDTYYPILAIGVTLPFICISSILKGYFFGKEEMFPATLSNVVEQLVRLGLTIWFIPRMMEYSLVFAIVFVVLINVVSEFVSILVLISFVSKNKVINVKDFKYNDKIMRNLLSISIPTTGSRLIGSFCYFLEPIILTFVLTRSGYSKEYITINYGIIQGYVYPLLLMPSFFTMAISNSLLPVISNSYSHRDYTYTKYKIKQALILSLVVGIPCTILLVVNAKFFLKLLYNTVEGEIFIKMMAPVFVLHYIQGPLTACMQAFSKAKEAMIGTLIGSIIKICLIFVLSYLHIGIWAFLIASGVNIIFVTGQHFYYVYMELKKK